MADECRKFWVDMLTKMAEPVLRNFSQRTLHENFKPEILADDREKYMGLEILGRTLAGMAPWLETPALDPQEEKKRIIYAEMARESIDAATDTESPNYCHFASGEKSWNEQWLVDSSYLALAIVRAPVELGKKLPDRVKTNLINAFLKTRNIRAVFNNWVLFSAMIEAGLYVLGADYDIMRVDYAIRQIEQWYTGDGLYADGPRFQLDYYNSYAIQPMYTHLVKLFSNNYVEMHHIYSKLHPVGEKIYKLTMTRFKRYARIQEMSISPDGSYPPFGRSIVYRCGAFQTLAQAALWEMLPKEVTPAMARCALTKVIKKTLCAKDTFSSDGWLQIGLCGHQPRLAQTYITTASLYMATLAFLPLGLSENNRFWSDKDEKITWEKIYSGKNVRSDHPLLTDEIIY